MAFRIACFERDAGDCQCPCPVQLANARLAVEPLGNVDAPAAAPLGKTSRQVIAQRDAKWMMLADRLWDIDRCPAEMPRHLPRGILAQRLGQFGKDVLPGRTRRVRHLARRLLCRRLDDAEFVPHQPEQRSELISP